VIVSAATFIRLVDLLAVGTFLAWGARDALALRALARRGRRTGPDRAVWQDQRKGALVGLVMSLLGLYGVLRHYLEP
jgi:hypothetical protein